MTTIFGKPRVIEPPTPVERQLMILVKTNESLVERNVQLSKRIEFLEGQLQLFFAHPVGSA
jgi:hypothetical protein